MNALRTLVLASCLTAATSLTAFAAPVAGFGELLSGWGVGAGQPTGGFNKSNNDSPELEIGLRAQDVGVGVSANNGLGGRYTVAAGERAPGLATWTLDFSVNSFESILDNFSIFLDIDWDPSAGVDLQSYDLGADASGVTLLQSAEAIGDGYRGQAFDPFATGTYVVTLRVSELDNPTFAAASTTIHIDVEGARNAVPEPGSLALAGLALGGLLLGRRRA
jgi:PEP-CTERM motif